MTKREKRMKMVVAMDYIARSINDETVAESWLMCGVPDGDIDHSADWKVEYDDEYYDDDETFSYIMGLFLRCMERANKSGGLYCGRVVSER